MTNSSDNKKGFDGLIGLADEELGGFDWDAEDSAQVDDETITVVRFRVGDRLFGIMGEAVREITTDLDVTPVPGAPKHIRGVSVIRRRVIGVLNLYQWLDPVAERDDVNTQRIIVVESNPYMVGFEATDVSGIEEWPASADDRGKIPETIGARTRRYAKGVRMVDGEAVVLLDVPRLLEDAAVQ
ncbi:MAG: chemotaxis protein CheW [Myxococcota bacterium]